MNEAKEAVNSGTDSNSYAHELDRSYTAGYESTEIGDRQDVILDMNYRRGQVESFVDSDMMALMDGNPMEAVSAIRNNGQWSNEQKQAAIDYVTANNSQEAMLQRINDDADALADEQREQTKQMQHTDGSLRPAILKEKDDEGHDRQVFIVDLNPTKRNNPPFQNEMPTMFKNEMLHFQKKMQRNKKKETVLNDRLLFVVEVFPMSFFQELRCLTEG